MLHNAIKLSYRFKLLLKCQVKRWMLITESPCSKADIYLKNVSTVIDEMSIFTEHFKLLSYLQLTMRISTDITLLQLNIILLT
jgi:hypothetical protein